MAVVRAAQGNAYAQDQELSWAIVIEHATPLDEQSRLAIDGMRKGGPARAAALVVIQQVTDLADKVLES